MKIIELKSNNKIFIGTSAQENWDILDNADSNDLWFHLSDLPSCHIILHGANFNSDDITMAAQQCKANTKYKNYKAIYVNYLEVNNVKKGKQPGQVILKKKPMKIKA